MNKPKKSVDNQLVREHPTIEGVGSPHPAIPNQNGPVADMVPSYSAKDRKVKETVSSLLKMKKHDLSEKDLNQFKAAGRK